MPTVTVGTHLGNYEVLSLLGKGGMGEVYKARDTRLDRTVAIKVLPEDVADRPEIRERFEREAKTISSLNHPHICALYDIGSHEGADFLVMEFLEGETLESRLYRGPIPPDQVLRYAIEIADALDKAHSQGITHRDLKPSNIMITKSGTKLLDFGLAKMLPGKTPTSSASMLPTMAGNLTVEGTILGTLQYMAPEQLEAQEADARTDIFAFGAVVYEMATGRKAFQGKSQPSLISAIMSSAPPPISTFQVAPQALDHLVKTCLEKNPADRWQTAHDVRVQLKWIADTGGQTGVAAAPVAVQVRKREMLAWTVATIAALFVIAMAIWTVSEVRGRPEPDEVRFSVSVPRMPNLLQLSVSPDGRWLAFVGSTAAGTTALFVRPLRSQAIQSLAGTEGASGLFWSPDSREIGFFSGTQLKKIPIAGGPPQVLCDGQNGGTGTWNRDGVIVFSSPSKGLSRVSASGGLPEPVTTLAASRQEVGHTSPAFLPDGHHFLYLAISPQDSNRAIYAGSLDSKETTRIIAVGSMPVYASPGYLIYQREATVFAQAFDAKKLVLTGEAIRLADQIPFNGGTGRAGFAMSQNGVMVYSNGAFGATQSFLWFDRTGKPVGAAGEVDAYTTNFDLSLDGKQLAMSIVDASGKSDLWLRELERNVKARFSHDGNTTGGGRDVVWSPDGLRIAYTRMNNGNQDIFEKNANGLGEETLLAGTTEPEFVEDWSKDGKYIVYVVGLPTREVWIRPLFGDGKPFPIVKSTFLVDEPHFSFDGRWLAYSSNESGTWQIYVISFPAADQKRQISTNGGGQPRWRRDGKELYYLATDGKMMSVEMGTGAKIEPGIPHVLFDTGLAVDPARDQYAVTSDGQRFLLLKPVGGVAETSLNVIVNWTASLKK